VALDEYEADPDTWREPFARALEASGAAADPDVLRAAQQLLTSIDVEGARASKYIVDLRSAQGVQTGDNNLQLNQFTTRPRKADRSPGCRGISFDPAAVMADMGRRLAVRWWYMDGRH